MRNTSHDTETDPLISQQAADVITDDKPEVKLPDSTSGKEFTVLEVRKANGDLIVDADGKGGMFRASGVEGAKPGDVVRVSYDETDENGYPVNAKATSIKQ